MHMQSTKASACRKVKGSSHVEQNLVPMPGDGNTDECRKGLTRCVMFAISRTILIGSYTNVTITVLQLACCKMCMQQSCL